ncbi:hypothetical protein KVV02_001820 [Mortierella alpina]|uniref:Uncharacterized protein n=1 Tax=Mortierella alpina TaxID=64518 RepID=A0A9P8A6C4_MORAP|nr:hypothetical protein KVV02_001820 [Mortierella alpina]
MDVVRITQALRQQQHAPARLTSSRGGSASAVSDEPSQLHSREQWDNSHSLNTAAHLAQENHRLEQNSRTAACTSTTSNPVSPSSPSSSFFSLPSSFSLASLLPNAATESSGFFSGTSAVASTSSGSANMGEIESLLLRSMPMFGNLVSRD